MTSQMMYWITRLDAVKDFTDTINVVFIVLSLVGIISAVFMFVAMTFIKNDAYHNDVDNDYNIIHALFKRVTAFTAVCFSLVMLTGAANIFIPTTKEIVAIKVIPLVASEDNCKKVERISKDFIDVTAKWLSDLNNKQ